VIRDAHASDFDAMIEIEMAAGEAFRGIGMAAIADDHPAGLDSLAAFMRSGVGWVATDAVDETDETDETDEVDHPVAYLLLEQIDDRAHIEQVTVHPDVARRGIGAALIETASAWSVAHGLRGLSLTTFADVPWNAPYYSRLGFTVLAERDWTDGIRARVLAETAHGLSAWPRIVMVRDPHSSLA
jgi:GNAT superfamily N-acetyltransferase